MSTTATTQTPAPVAVEREGITFTFVGVDLMPAVAGVISHAFSISARLVGGSRFCSIGLLVVERSGSSSMSTRDDSPVRKIAALPEFCTPYMLADLLVEQAPAISGRLS